MRLGRTIDGRDISLPVEIGGSIDERYEIERIIGEGLTSVVYAARRRGLGQRVALKFLVRESVQRGEALEKFRREALAAADFTSDYACRVLDVRTLDNGVPYLVMEYLEGCNLASELGSRTRLPPLEALRYVLEACEPISEAHAAGVIHRDLKLENLFLVSHPDGSRHVKVMDFGVPNVLIDSDASSRSLPMSLRALSSLAYKAPEQLDLARDIDARVDVWSLGVVLYELLTGSRPFAGASIAALVHAVLHDAPSPFFAASVIAPDGLESVLHKALAKSRDERYASIAELVAALAPFAPEDVIASLHISSTRSAAPGSTTIELDESVFEPVAEQATEHKGRGRLYAALAIGALFVLGLAFLWRPAPQPASPPIAAAPAPTPSPIAAAPRAPAPTPPPAPEPAAPEPSEAPVKVDTTPPPTAAAPVTPVAPAKPVEPQPQPKAAPVAAIAWRAPAHPTPVPSRPNKPPPAPRVAELPDFGGRR